MKCVLDSKTGEIKRVKEAEAAAMVAEGWAYCGKEKWKEAVRSDAKPKKGKKASKKGSVKKS